MLMLKTGCRCRVAATGDTLKYYIEQWLMQELLVYHKCKKMTKKYNIETIRIPIFKLKMFGFT